MFRGIKWWKWIGLFFIAIYAVRGIGTLLGGVVTTRAVLEAVVCPILLVWYFTARYLSSRGFNEDENHPLVSIVMMLREPRYLDADIVKTVVAQAWGITVGGEEEDDTFVAGEDQHFIIKSPKGLFVLHNIPAPYFENVSAMADEIDELRFRKMLVEHKAWMSVDLISSFEDEPREKAYPLIGKLIAELADETCLALGSPETQQAVLYNEELDRDLRSDDPMLAFSGLVHVPVVNVDEDDPRMEAAVEEARCRWPEFVKAFESRQPDQMFSVKAPFSEGDECEFMWLNVSAIENDTIYGELGNDPVNLEGMREGDRLHVKLADLNDWMYQEDDKLHGGFTVKVLGDQ